MKGYTKKHLSLALSAGRATWKAHRATSEVNSEWNSPHILLLEAERLSNKAHSLMEEARDQAEFDKQRADAENLMFGTE